MTIKMELLEEILEFCERRGIELVAIKGGCKYFDVAMVTTWDTANYRIGYYDYGHLQHFLDLPSASAYERDMKDALVQFYSMG